MAFAPDQRRKEEEETTQTLEIPPEPPGFITAETRRLQFTISPLSAKGLLSQQVRDALRAINRANRRATVVKLRAFVAGSGDVRRVTSIVGETYGRRRGATVPALTVVQVGGLPMTGAQVLIEATAVARKETSPNGLVFISGQAAASNDLIPRMGPLADKVLTDLATAVKAAGAGPGDVPSVSCFVSSLDDAAEVRSRFAAAYPKAALTYVQIQRAPVRSIVECEAVAYPRQPVSEPFRLVNPDGLPKSPNYTQIAFVGAPRIVMTSGQLSFRYQDSDARLAFERLGRTLNEAGVTFNDVFLSRGYPISQTLADQVRRVRQEFYSKESPPASTMLPFEGLPAMEAGFSIEVLAAHK